ncbi:S66 peptidase family protein [Arcticibacter tournemirensis]|uniref:LD-carboxypeptidase n=1 Tax=Arcticibacter tournemirensis TaxID=699437 RepID=A0A4Q0MCN6_9SPHI|nr:LD-carboxypeptidase [Arcticibacter tournemirensis]RXF70669.1 LD-carboxypeptidase [Arcticibacter tournemirensis]
MNRKHFLSALLPAGLVLSSVKSWGSVPAPPKHRKIKTPPYLKEGDTIGITCPAGYISTEDIQPAIQLMESWGFRVKSGKTIGLRNFSMGGTDEERRLDFQQMIDDKEISAIMCARGGYGSLRIVDQLDFSSLYNHPKWIIGFSDITVLHCHLNQRYNIASIHSKMCNSFPTDWTKAEPIQIETILSIKQALTGEQMAYTAPTTVFNRAGKAEGILVGGNLRTIENLAGSVSDLNTRNKILFVEDTGEYLYSIDRMFWNLKRNGKLSGLKGLLIGGFKIKPDDPGEEFGKTIYDIVLEKVKEYNYPVCFDFPVGHQKNNFALRCGVHHLLDVNASTVTLTSATR